MLCGNVSHLCAVVSVTDLVIVSVCLYPLCVCVCSAVSFRQGTRCLIGDGSHVCIAVAVFNTDG